MSKQTEQELYSLCVKAQGVHMRVSKQLTRRRKDGRPVINFGTKKRDELVKREQEAWKELEKLVNKYRQCNTSTKKKTFK